MIFLSKFPELSVEWFIFVSFQETQQFPDFLETNTGNFRTICPRLKIVGIFGWLKSAFKHFSFNQKIEFLGKGRHWLAMFPFAEKYKWLAVNCPGYSEMNYLLPKLALWLSLVRVKLSSWT